MKIVSIYNNKKKVMGKGKAFGGFAVQQWRKLQKYCL